MRNEYDQSRIRNSHPKLLSTVNSNSPEPDNCSRSTFWVVWFFCWTAQNMWKTFLSHRLNIQQLFANTHYSSVFVPYWHLVWNLNSQAESLFNLPWYHHSSCQGIQTCSIHPSLVWRWIFLKKSWNTFSLKIAKA